MDFDMTQVIDDADASEEEQPRNYEPTYVLKLHGAKQNAGTPQLKIGTNVIGRLPSLDICLNMKAVSQRHLCLHVHRDYVLIEDLGSRNKTRKGKITLVPHVRYNLECGEEFCIGGAVRAQVVKYGTKEGADDSDTCSESLLLPEEGTSAVATKDAIKEGSPASQASTVACSSPSHRSYNADNKALQSSSHTDGTQEEDGETGGNKLMNEMQDEGFRNMPTQALPPLDLLSDIPTLNRFTPDMSNKEDATLNESMELRYAPTQALSERIPDEGDFHLAVTQDFESRQKEAYPEAASAPSDKLTAERSTKNGDTNFKENLSTYFLVSSTQECTEIVLDKGDTCSDDEVYCAATQDFSADIRLEEAVNLEPTEIQTPPGSNVGSPQNSIELSPREYLDVVPESEEEDVSGLNITVIPPPHLTNSVSTSRPETARENDRRKAEGVSSQFSAQVLQSEGGNWERPANNNEVHKEGYEENIVTAKEEEMAQENASTKTLESAPDGEPDMCVGQSAGKESPVRSSGCQNGTCSQVSNTEEGRTQVHKSTPHLNGSPEGNAQAEESCSDSPWRSRYIKYPETQDALPSFSQLMTRGEEKKDIPHEGSRAENPRSCSKKLASGRGGECRQQPSSRSLRSRKQTAEGEGSKDGASKLNANEEVIWSPLNKRRKRQKGKCERQVSIVPKGYKLDPPPTTREREAAPNKSVACTRAKTQTVHSVGISQERKSPRFGRDVPNRKNDNAPETDTLNNKHKKERKVEKNCPKAGKNDLEESSWSGRKRRESKGQKEEGSMTTAKKLRKRSATKKSLEPKVLFTGLEDSKGEEIVEKLGGQVAQCISECTHLVTDKFRRTVKTLCCIAMGVPIITVQWLHKCQADGKFTDHRPYLLRDSEAEQGFGFALERTLRCAAQQRLLQNWNIHVTANVKPPLQDMKEIIVCAGGRYVPKMPQRPLENTVVISCELDRRCYSAAAKKSIPVVSPEFLLTGLLQHKLDLVKYAL